MSDFKTNFDGISELTVTDDNLVYNLPDRGNL